MRILGTGYGGRMKESQKRSRETPAARMSHELSFRSAISLSIGWTGGTTDGAIITVEKLGRKFE